MIKKKKTEPLKEETLVEEKGRQEEDYFFPEYRVTIKASSLQEAINKLQKK